MTRSSRRLVIAIDGPAGSGKSTAAKELARRLGVFYLDTGAMYRALALKAMQEGLDMDDEDALVVLAGRTGIELEGTSEGLRVLLDGKDVSKNIRTPEVTNKTFYVARAGRIRAIMVGRQQAMGRSKSLVAEGRDVTTVVFPDATLKFYLDADLAERSRRRYEEFLAKGDHVQAAQVLKELQERDAKDLNRSVGPLKRAEDAIYIDSTHLSIAQTVEEMLTHIEKVR